MEPLCPNLDLKPFHLSPISTKSISPLFYSHRYRSSNRRLSCLKRRVSLQRDDSSSKSEEWQFSGKEWLRSVGKGIFGFAATSAALFSVFCDSPALSESLTVAFPVSRAPEVNKVQRTLVEAWGLIRETFVDPTFNHQGDDLKTIGNGQDK